MKFPNKEELARIRQTYPAGTRVELTAPLDDPCLKLTTGDRGTVTAVFGNGDIGVSWDAGSSLHLIPGVDSFRIVSAPASDTVVEQILAVRATGRVNMFSVNEVQAVAFEMEFYELVNFITDEPKRYSRFILTGNTEE